MAVLQVNISANFLQNFYPARETRDRDPWQQVNSEGQFPQLSSKQTLILLFSSILPLFFMWFYPLPAFQYPRHPCVAVWGCNPLHFRLIHTQFWHYSQLAPCVGLSDRFLFHPFTTMKNRKKCRLGAYDLNFNRTVCSKSMMCRYQHTSSVDMLAVRGANIMAPSCPPLVPYHYLKV